MSCPPADQIQQFLDGSLTAALRASIDVHLGDCAVCRALVLALGSAVTVPASDDVPRADESLRAGEQVGRFVVIARLGQGGMGVVYSAYDPELDRKVALKLIRPQAGPGTPAATLQARLLREAHAMAKIAHPNVTAVYEVGRRGEELFVAMELIDGETVAQWLVRTHPSPREVLDVFVRAGRGLFAAHSAGLVHRDFKPSNVMIARDGRVRVMDFGLARPLDALPDGALPSPASPSTANVTVTGALIGTPAYMAPEQLTRQQSDARTDQFAFCVSLYEAMTGTRPFKGGDLEAVSDAIKAGRIERPARRISGRLLRVIERGLRADPAERWPTLALLLDALERRQRWSWRAGVPAALAVVLGAGVIGWHELGRRHALLCRGGAAELAGVWDDARKQELAGTFRASGRSGAEKSWAAFRRAIDDYADSWVRMHQSNCEATRLRGEQSEMMLDRRLACLDRRRAELRALVDVVAGADAPVIDRAAAAAGTLEPVAACAPEAIVAGEPLPSSRAKRAELEALQAKLGRVRALQSVSRIKEAAPLADEVIAAAERAQEPRLAAEARYWRASIAQSSGQLDQGEEGLRRAGGEALALGRDDVVLRAYASLGYVLGLQSRFDAAHVAFDIARATLRRLPGRSDLELVSLRLAASALVNEAASADKKRLPEAIAMFQHALVVARDSGLAETPIAAELHGGLGRALTEAQRFDEAIESLRRAVALSEALNGPESPRISLYQLQIAFALRKLERYDEAIAMGKQALRARRAAFGDSPHVVEALKVIASFYGSAHRWREAIPWGEQALEMAERVHDQYDDVPETLTDLGDAYSHVGELVKARAAFERALSHPQFASMGKHVVGSTRFGLAQLVWTQDPKRALELARQALADFAKAPPEEVREEHAAVERWLRAHQ